MQAVNLKYTRGYNYGALRHGDGVLGAARAGVLATGGNAPGRPGEVTEGGPMVHYVAMVDYKLFSADSHVSEPPDLWLERIGQAYAYRAPRVESRMKDGRVQEFLIYEGFPPHPVSVGLASAAREGNKSEYTESGKGYSGALKGGWDPAARLEDQDIDGVEAEILHATLCFRLFWLKDAALQRACFTAYNDWLAEFCSYAPKRLIGVPCISLYDIDLAVEELQRTAKLGLRGAMIWLSPPAGAPAYDNPIYDKFWAAAQDLGDPHLGWEVVTCGAVYVHHFLLDPGAGQAWCRRGLAQPRLDTIAYALDAVRDQHASALLGMGEADAARDVLAYGHPCARAELFGVHVLTAVDERKQRAETHVPDARSATEWPSTAIYSWTDGEEHEGYEHVIAVGGRETVTGSAFTSREVDHLRNGLGGHGAEVKGRARTGPQRGTHKRGLSRGRRHGARRGAARDPRLRQRRSGHGHRARGR